MSGDAPTPATDAVRDVLRELGRRPVAVPAGLGPGVMRRVRALRAPRGHLRLEGTRGGTTAVAERVVVRIGGLAARRVPGVAYASVALDEEGSATVGVVALLGPSLPALAVEVRRAVRGSVRRDCGVELGRIDVRIDDVTG